MQPSMKMSLIRPMARNERPATLTSASCHFSILATDLEAELIDGGVGVGVPLGPVEGDHVRALTAGPDRENRTGHRERETVRQPG